MRIAVDSREQAPYSFTAKQYEGATVIVGTLTTGDYSLAGFENNIAIERKSLDDLTGTLTQGRDRFQRECQRGKGLSYFGLVVEASLEEVRLHKYRSRMTPQSLLQTLCAYSVRYGLHVHWCGSREGGEYMTHSLLQKFLREQQRTFEALQKHIEEA